MFEINFGVSFLKIAR